MTERDIMTGYPIYADDIDWMVTLSYVFHLPTSKSKALKTVNIVAHIQGLT